MKYFILVALTAIVTGLAVTAYFKGWLPQVSFTKPQAVSVQSTEVATPAVSPVISSSPSATPASETEILIAAIKTQLIVKHGQDATSLNITVSKIEGNYAKGMASASGGGGIWFAAKVNGNWMLVWDGNGQINCSDIANYPNFPVDLVSECWDATSNKIITR